MTRPVTLSEEAFAALRKARRPSESTSDAVLRLLHESEAGRKNPLNFLRLRLKRRMTIEEHLRAINDSTEKDRGNAWEK